MSEPTLFTVVELLEQRFGSFARATQRTGSTCRTCAAPLTGDFSDCYPCGQIYGADRPDCAGFVVYAQPDDTAGRLMHAYKGEAPTPEATAFVQLLLAHGLIHLPCAEELVGASITHFAVVPSTQPSRATQTPLLLTWLPYRLKSELIYLPLTHGEGSKARKKISPELFRSSPLEVSDAHVLIVDDTWVSGGNMLSAVHAVRTAGAAHITTLALARWLKEPAQDFLDSLKDPPRFDVSSCPFGAGQKCQVSRSAT